MPNKKLFSRRKFLQAGLITAGGLALAARQRALAQTALPPRVYLPLIARNATPESELFRTGVAPLCVHFTADLSVSPPASTNFHTYDYTWNFGDAGAGTWGTTGKSKNAAKGPIAAHVYETPGTYIATLTVRNSGGIVRSDSFKIVVTDPNTVYAGMATTCVSDSAHNDFSGAPAGARRITTNDLSSITQYATAGSRILFQRGASWMTSGLSWPTNGGPVTIGAFGSGEAPVVTVTGGTFLDLTDKRDWRIMDLDLRDSSRSFGAFGGVSNMQRLLMLRIRTRGFVDGIGWSHWNDGELYTIDQMALVDCDLAEAQENVVYVGSERLILLGNRMQDAQESHVTRVWQAYMSVISHNVISGSSLTTTAGRHALKLHGPGPDENRPPVRDSSYLKNRTDFCVVSDNLIGSSGPWPITIGPADDWQGAEVTNVIFERNRVVSEYGSQSSTPVQLSLYASGRYFTIRNNIFDGTKSSTGYTGILVAPRGIEPPPLEVRVYNNTIFRADNGSGNGRVGIRVGAEAVATSIKNNLVSFPGTMIPTLLLENLSSDASVANNLMPANANFYDATNADPLARNFGLQAGSPAINAGTTVPVFEDYAGTVRPNGVYDIGAFESH